MFLIGDQVKILYSPADPDNHNGKLAEILPWQNLPVAKIPAATAEGPFIPTIWENANAFHTVRVLETGEITNAYVRHDVRIGDPIIVVKAPVGWKELQSKIVALEGIHQRKYRVRASGRAPMSVDLEDIRPVRMVKFVETGISKDDIVKAALEVADPTDIYQGSEIGDLLHKLGVSLKDDAEIIVDTTVSLGFTLSVMYGKSVDIADPITAARALAKRFLTLSEDELALYLASRIEDITA